MGKSLIAKFQKELLELRLTYFALFLFAPMAFAVASKVSFNSPDLKRGINLKEISIKAGTTDKMGSAEEAPKDMATIQVNATNTAVRLPFADQNQATATNHQFPKVIPKSPIGKDIQPMTL